MSDPFAPYVPRLLRRRGAAAGPGHWQTDGTLVFADISGFTRLTEKLSRQGKAGAEEIVGSARKVGDWQRGDDLEAFVARHDARRPLIGQITFVFATRG